VPNLTSIILSIAATVAVSAVLALVTYVRQTVQSRLAGDALALLASLAGTLVLAAMEEVRDLKDPTKPGTWTPEEAARVKGKVMSELRTFGAALIVQLKDLHGLSEESVLSLLDRLVEEQVESLRTKTSPSATVNVLTPSA
jgi:hypothetical protein